MTKSLTKAMRYCSKAEHCVDDVRQKLWAWKVPTEEHDDIINTLIDNNFINEQRYANAFVKDKFRFNHWGRIKISIMLRAKKIDAAIIDDALSSIDEDEYLDTLRNLISRWSAETDQQKLMRKAVSRGFEPNLVREVISSLS